MLYLMDLNKKKMWTIIRLKWNLCFTFKSHKVSYTLCKSLKNIYIFIVIIVLYHNFMSWHCGTIIIIIIEICIVMVSNTANNFKWPQTTNPFNRIFSLLKMMMMIVIVLLCFGFASCSMSCLQVSFRNSEAYHIETLVLAWSLTLNKGKLA